MNLGRSKLLLGAIGVSVGLHVSALSLLSHNSGGHKAKSVTSIPKSLQPLHVVSLTAPISQSSDRVVVAGAANKSERLQTYSVDELKSTLPEAIEPRQADAHVADLDEFNPNLSSSSPQIVYYPSSKLDQNSVPLQEVTPVIPTETGASVPIGFVKVRLLISDEGVVDKVIAEDSNLDQRYIDAAVAAFREVKFSPGYINGHPVNSQKLIQVDYSPDTFEAVTKPSSGDVQHLH